MSLVDAQNEIPEKNRFRLIVVGSPMVGKTALIRRFLDNTFSDRYNPTIEDFYTKLYIIKGERYILEIIDTSGLNPYPAKQRLSFMSADLFLLTFALNNRTSFEAIQGLRQQILEVTKSNHRIIKGQQKCYTTPMVIVGNKLDLPREITEREVTEYLNSIQGRRGCPFVECSAREDVNIDEIFIKLFVFANVPTAMSPANHKRVAETQYLKGISTKGCNISWLGGVHKLSFRRKFSDVGLLAVDTQKPGIDAELRRVEAKMQAQRKRRNGIKHTLNSCCLL